MKKLFYIIVSIYTIPIAAQENNAYFRKISSEEGLPSNYVEAICQTHDGFMWFGSSDGLSRFDGLSFLNFRNDQSDTTSLIDNEIKCLAEDKYGRLWIGTQKGLTYLDLKTYRFKWFNKEFPENLGNCWISSFAKMSDNELLIGTYGYGLFVFNMNTKKVLKIYLEGEESNQLINNNIRCIRPDRHGNIWVATDGGLDVIKNGKSEIVHLLKEEIIFNLCLDNAGNILVTSLNSNNLYTFSPISFQTIKVEKANTKSTQMAKLFFIDSGGNSWLSISGEGLYRTSHQNNSKQHFVSNNFDTDGLSSNNILAIYEDRDGNLWFGTFDAGVIFLSKHRKPFIKIKNNNRKNGLINNQIRFIHQDRDGEIWIGTKSGGMLSKFNREDLTFVHYKNIPNNPTSLNDDIVRAITDGEPGTIWAGTLTGGINILNKKTGKFSFLKNYPGGNNQIASNNIAALYNDNFGKICVGHGENGLDIYDLNTRSIVHFSHTSNSYSLSDNRVRAILRDSGGNMWIGTMHGLNLLASEQNNFQIFINRWNDTSSISGNNITCIYEDIKKNIWIGTTNGFNLWNSKTRTFTVFNNTKGFPGSSVRGMLGDKDGNLWISTENGLIKYDIKKRNYKRYSKADGLNSNEFTQYAFCKSRNGEMYFGTGNGFVIFDPGSIMNNTTRPNVVISKFKLFNKEINMDIPGSPLHTDITVTKAIKLNYKQSVFTFDFTALNYTTPENNQFAYMLDGIDNNWIYIGTRRDVTFTNLPPGKYTFRVKASNNDGYWNEEGTSLRITILPPPWRTWWAFSLYILVILLILWKYRDITIKKIHAEKEHEIDKMKIKLFMNISHEFRTPLTLMISPLKKIDSSEDINEIKTSLKTVQRSTWKLLNLVNQLLDFRKIDQGGSPLKAKEGDIVGFTRQICELFNDLAIAKNIELRFKSNLSSLHVWLDPNKYEKIINNLLSNALKFTDSGGDIIIQIDKAKPKAEFNLVKVLKQRIPREFAEVRVTDTGIGLTRENIRNIFERFYQVDQSKAGTGIGLNYVKSLVDLHAGEVLVESEPGVGSSFIIRFPLGDEHLRTEQKDLTDKGFGDYFDRTAVESLQYDISGSDIYPINNLDTEYIPEECRENKVVLLVEDNKALRKQIIEELKDVYNVKEASNGLEGWEKALRILPDIVISDIMMPKMDGIEFCRRMKTDINTSHIPVILLTARGTIEDKIEGFETGADEYIPKPFSMQLLKVRVKNLINSKAVLKEKYSTSKVLAPAKEYTTNNLDEAFLEKATQIVLENIADPDFSATELRNIMGMSRTNLYNKIQSITGQNPSNFVRTIRLKYASELLLQNADSVKDVCYKCGFNSPAYFIKTFRELFGQTPKEYVDSNEKKRGTI
jgi:signal transduction histidine kinase/ligand-binding sensor domain-containing protein/DNA-binding NarL/FixJ family response regulator